MSTETASASWLDGAKLGILLGLAVLALTLPPAHLQRGSTVGPAGDAAGPAVVAPAFERRLDWRGETAASDVDAVARWVVASADNGARPFVIVDKRRARIYVFSREGTLRGATPVLLGYAVGDDSVAGIGRRPIADVQPDERTTPAGRFVSEPGRNALGEDVVWVDYESAVSMHRVRTTNPRERRLERLASPDASEHRISYGCINVPLAFYDSVVMPALSRHHGVIYVLPETKSLGEVFPALGATAGASPNPGAAPAT
jgi:hypothetical protein